MEKKSKGRKRETVSIEEIREQISKMKNLTVELEAYVDRIEYVVLKSHPKRKKPTVETGGMSSVRNAIKFMTHSANELRRTDQKLSLG